MCFRLSSSSLLCETQCVKLAFLQRILAGRRTPPPLRREKLRFKIKHGRIKSSPTSPTHTRAKKKGRLESNETKIWGSGASSCEEVLLIACFRYLARRNRGERSGQTGESVASGDPLINSRVRDASSVCHLQVNSTAGRRGGSGESCTAPLFRTGRREPVRMRACLAQKASGHARLLALSKPFRPK